MSELMSWKFQLIKNMFLTPLGLASKLPALKRELIKLGRTLN